MANNTKDTSLVLAVAPDTEQAAANHEVELLCDSGNYASLLAAALAWHGGQAEAAISTTTPAEPRRVLGIKSFKQFWGFAVRPDGRIVLVAKHEIAPALFVSLWEEGDQLRADILNLPPQPLSLGEHNYALLVSPDGLWYRTQEPQENQWIFKRFGANATATTALKSDFGKVVVDQDNGLLFATYGEPTKVLRWHPNWGSNCADATRSLPSGPPPDDWYAHPNGIAYRRGQDLWLEPAQNEKGGGMLLTLPEDHADVFCVAGGAYVVRKNRKGKLNPDGNRETHEAAIWFYPRMRPGTALAKRPIHKPVWHRLEIQYTCADAGGIIESGSFCPSCVEVANRAGFAIFVLLIVVAVLSGSTIAVMRWAAFWYVIAYCLTAWPLALTICYLTKRRIWLNHAEDRARAALPPAESTEATTALMPERETAIVRDYIGHELDELRERLAGEASHAAKSIAELDAEIHALVVQAGQLESYCREVEGAGGSAPEQRETAAEHRREIEELGSVRNLYARQRANIESCLKRCVSKWRTEAEGVLLLQESAKLSTRARETLVRARRRQADDFTQLRMEFDRIERQMLAHGEAVRAKLEAGSVDTATLEDFDLALALSRLAKIDPTLVEPKPAFVRVATDDTKEDRPAESERAPALETPALVNHL
ncbi:MAG: hypothetical protein PHT12_02050 [Patescibacteria group bacterium]|nr:hypothetical protein [Patescibacteria group bacterium]